MPLYVRGENILRKLTCPRFLPHTSMNLPQQGKQQHDATRTSVPQCKQKQDEAQTKNTRRLQPAGRDQLRLMSQMPALPVAASWCHHEASQRHCLPTSL